MDFIDNLIKAKENKNKQSEKDQKKDNEIQNLIKEKEDKNED